jgi:ribosomal protein S18 acetylase RimI-like enzyme
LGAFEYEKLLGYCIFDPASGDLPQIAVDKEYRREGVGTSLLREVLNQNKNSNIRIINTDILCDSITDFLKAKNIEITGKQFEMIKKL